MSNVQDACRLSIAATGAFNHPLGDQTPIDCRYSELIDTVQLPHRQIVRVTEPTVIDYGALQNPRAVIVWNVSGEGLQLQPSPDERAAIAAQVLEVALLGPDGMGWSLGWQSIRPAVPGHSRGGSTILWLARGTRVMLRPELPDTYVMARVLVLPGQ